MRWPWTLNRERRCLMGYSTGRLTCWRKIKGNRLFCEKHAIR